MRRKLVDQLYPAEHPLLRVRLLEKNFQHQSLVRQFARECLYGIDFDPDLKRAARLNMILNNDGHGNILSFNSLECPLMLGDQTISELRHEYATRPIHEIPDAGRACLDAPLGSFDFVFTNPPFGAKIPVDDPNILQQFDLGHRCEKIDHGGEIGWAPTYGRQTRVAPEVLFVELCVQWVKLGTRKVAIVLPDGILGNPDAALIRYWILTRCHVLAGQRRPAG